MSFMYCPSCGTKVEYTLTKPNFCTNCGQKFNSAMAQSKNTAHAQSSNQEPDNPVENFDSKKYLNISRLDVEIIKGNSHSPTLEIL